MGGLGQEKRCPKKRGPWTRVWGMGRCCELGAETGTRLLRPPRRPQPRGPDGSPSVNPPRPWGQTSGVHTGQRSRVPGSPPRLCRPGCRLSLADVGGLLGGSVCVCWGITQNLGPPPRQPRTQTAQLCTVCGTLSPGSPPPRPPARPVPAQWGPLLPGLHPPGVTAVPSLPHGHAQPGPGTVRPVRPTRCPWSARRAVV